MNETDASRRAQIEKRRDNRADASIVISIVASLPVWLTAMVGFAASNLRGVEDGMEMSILALFCGGPVWLVGAGLALASLRVRAVVAALGYPLAWAIVIVATT